MERNYQIGLWPGMGYGLNVFNVTGTCEADAIDNLVAKLVNENIGEGLYWETIESMEDRFSEEEIADMGYVYIDATMNGANYPVYLLLREAKILS